MGYVKQTWVDKETPIDAAHMNHLENGVRALSEDMEKMITQSEIDELYAELEGTSDEETV